MWWIWRMIAILTLSYVFSFSFTLAFHKNGINLRSISTFFLQNRIQIETISSLTCNVKIMTLNLSIIIIDFHFGWIDCFRSREFIIDTHVNIFRCSSMQKISIKRSERWTFFLRYNSLTSFHFSHIKHTNIWFVQLIREILHSSTSSILHSESLFHLRLCRLS